MAVPQINGITPSSTTWALNQSCSFDLSGSQFAGSATVKMSDSRATWAPAVYDTRTANHVRFHSYPRKIKSGLLPAGSLTITVTNPPSSWSQTSVRGSYIQSVTTPNVVVQKPELKVDSAIWVTTGSYHFEIKGGPFDERTTVHLEDDRAEWHPPQVTACTAGRIGFRSHPTTIHPSAAGSGTAGALTINVKGPGGEVSARGQVEGKYQEG